jgi:ketosteroid isomerase-like protein
MKKRPALLFFCLVLSAAALRAVESPAQTPGGAKQTPPGPVAAQTEDAARLEALERELVAAIARKDLATYDRIVADDYAVQDVSGKSITKPEIMASYRDGTRGYRELTIYDVVARVYGDTAVVSARTRGFRVEDGREVENRVRYIRVYARRGGSWKAVAQMAAPESEAPAPARRPG